MLCTRYLQITQEQILLFVKASLMPSTLEPERLHNIQEVLFRGIVHNTQHNHKFHSFPN